MANFESSRRVASKTPGYEDVVFVLTKMTERARIRLNLALAESKAKLRALLAERKELGEDPDAEAIETLAEKFAEVSNREVQPAWLAWGLRAIENYSVDGEPVITAADLAGGDPALYAEAYDLVRREAGLSGDEQKNSPSPTTSGAPDQAKTSDSTAPSASELAVS
jgi:hypothetical protein